MTPDVRAAREVALAAFGIPLDHPATLDNPATGRPARVNLKGWVSFTLGGSEVPACVKRGPPDLVVVLVLEPGLKYALVHAVVFNALAAGPGPWQLSPQELRRALDVPGALDAAAAAERVGGGAASAEVLRTLAGVQP